MPLSYSQLQTYRRCPRQYEYAYVKKLPAPLSAGESFGSSIHNTLKKWGELELMESSALRVDSTNQLALFIEKNDQPVTRNALTEETLLRLWHQSFIVEGYATRVEADFQRSIGENILRDFFAWWSTEPHEVVVIEKGFTCTLEGGETLSGRFDRVERTEHGLRIIDFKTGDPRPQESVDADLQLSIYALAARDLWEEPVEELVFLFLNRDGITALSTTRNASQLHDAAKSIRVLAERITEKDFRPTPALEKCRRCPYRRVCDVAAV